MSIAEPNYSSRTDGSQSRQEYILRNLVDGQDTDMYIYVRSQEEHYNGRKPNGEQRYHIHISRAKDNRALASVMIVGDEAGLNVDQQCITDMEVTSKTAVVTGTVAAASEQVSLDITADEITAYVSLYELDENGDFTAEPMKFYIPVGLNTREGDYNYNETTGEYEYVGKGNGAYMMKDQFLQRMGTQYIEVAAGTGVYKWDPIA